MSATDNELAPRAFKETLDRLLAASPQLELGDPVAAGRRGALYVAARGLWERHLEGFLTAEQTRELLGFHNQDGVDDLVRRRRLLRLEDHAGHSLYPLVQFDRSGRPFEILDRILAAFERAQPSAWTAASFLASPQGLLEGETPRNWLISNREPEHVLEAARRVSANLAR